MRRGDRVDRALSVAPWLLFVLAFGTELAIEGPSVKPNSTLLTSTLGIFFCLVALRLLFALRRQPSRRAALGSLLAGIVLWSTESALLTVTAPQSQGAYHPSLGELLFLLSYLAMAAFIVIDADNRVRLGVVATLEVIMVCGGCISIAGSIALTPWLRGLGSPSAALLAALLYPIADVVLAALVLSQVLLTMRARSASNVCLAAGLLCLAAADVLFAGHVVHGNDGASILVNVLWGSGFTLIVQSATKAKQQARLTRPRSLPAPVMVAAGGISLAVLLGRPDDLIGLGLCLSATLTLLAVGTRLVISLREARLAADAFTLSRTDDLTLLPNRRAILAKIDEHLLDGKPLGLMIMDLDGFKEINDTLGHSAGDLVLQSVARHIREALPQSLLVGRLGGDEFALLAPVADDIRLLRLARNALAAVSQPTSIDDIELVVNGSVGITVSEDPGESSSALLRRADVAMYRAKKTRSGVALYDPAHDEFSRTKLQFVEELRRGIANRQLEVWYQPKLDAATLRICGLEALVRWRHPSEGLLSPIAFLPVARQAGLMGALSDAVADAVVRDVRHWRRQGERVRVSLNCAPPELLGGGFVKGLLQSIRNGDLHPEDFTIEITEDSFLHDPHRTRTLLRSIGETGLRISIDDYGTGFSSLAYLRDLPIDELKIDRSFVTSMMSDPRSFQIVASTYQMARALDLQFVAEGVEDPSTSSALVAMGVDILQGYHFGRPMPAGQVLSRLREPAELDPGIAS